MTNSKCCFFCLSNIHKSAFRNLIAVSTCYQSGSLTYESVTSVQSMCDGSIGWGVMFTELSMMSQIWLLRFWALPLCKLCVAPIVILAVNLHLPALISWGKQRVMTGRILHLLSGLFFCSESFLVIPILSPYKLATLFEMATPWSDVVACVTISARNALYIKVDLDSSPFVGGAGAMRFTASASNLPSILIFVWCTRGSL